MLGFSPSAGHCFVKEFQKYYSGTKWYWASNVIGLPVEIHDYKLINASRGGQVHLVSDDKKRSIRYTEMEHRTGMKTFYGHEVLQEIDGVDAPFFEVAGKRNMFIGFFDGRLFRIEVVSWGEDRTSVRREITALGLEVLADDQKRHTPYGR